MCRISQHGLVFSLIADPSEALWIEIRREADQAVVQSAAYRGTVAGFEDAVTEWIDRFVTNAVNELELEECLACGGRRRDLGDIERDLTPTEVIEARFRLCPPCSHHLVASNSWIARVYAADYCDD